MHLMFGGMFGGHFVSSNVTHPPPTDRYHSYSPMSSMMLGTCGALVSKKSKKGKLCWPLFRGPKSISQELSQIIMQVEPIIIRFGCVEIFFGLG